MAEPKTKIREIHGVHLTPEDLDAIRDGKIVEKLIWRDEFEDGSVEESLARIALKGVSVFGSGLR